MISPKILFLVCAINLVSAVVSLQNKYGTFCCFNSKTAMVRKLFEAGTYYQEPIRWALGIIYEEQPFYSLERVSKPRENAFGTRYLIHR